MHAGAHGERGGRGEEDTYASRGSVAHTDAYSVGPPTLDSRVSIDETIRFRDESCRQSDCASAAIVASPTRGRLRQSPSLTLMSTISPLGGCETNTTRSGSGRMTIFSMGPLPLPRPMLPRR